MYLTCSTIWCQRTARIRN